MSDTLPPREAKPTCFVIMPIADVQGYEAGHFGRVYEHLLKPAIVKAGYTPVRADDTTKTDYIVVGIVKSMVESEMVLCDYSARNPNVMYELGIRHAFNKPVTLVKDKNTGKVFDIQGLRYTEYDDTLRIDTVQKDIERIASALRATAAPAPGAVNSVVQLAGLQPAEVPEGQSVSPDTQLLLSAIGDLATSFDAYGRRQNTGPVFFLLEKDLVTFSDNSMANLGDEIFKNGDKIGELVDIHPAEGRIFIKYPEGKIVPFSRTSIKSDGLSTIPF